MRLRFRQTILTTFCTLLATAASLQAEEPFHRDSAFSSAVHEAPAHTSDMRRLPNVQPAQFQEASATSYENTSNDLLASRMEMLEAELAAIRSGMAKGDGDGGSSGSGPVMPGHSASKMKIAGRVHADAWHFPGDSPAVNELETGDPLISPQDRLGFRRVRFGVRGTLPANMDYRIEMEFAGGEDSEFRDVWLGWKDLVILQTLLVGNQKRPYGLDHLNSSRYNVFLERPFVIEAINQDARRLGICSYGVSENQRWNWRYGVYNQRLIQDEGNYISDHLQLEFAGRLANTIWYDECSDGRGYAHWALSGTIAHPDGSPPADGPPGRAVNEARFQTRPEARTRARWLNTGRIAGADWYQLLGVEGVVNVGPVQVVGEYQSVWLQRDAGFGPDLRFDGGYVYVSYFLTGEHMVWSRKSGTLGRVKPFENFFLVDRCSGGIGRGLGAWQIAARYSYADFNSDDIFGGVGQSFTFGVNWYWTPYARLQFNFIHGNIKDREDPSDPAALVGGDYSIIGMRAMVDF